MKPLKFCPQLKQTMWGGNRIIPLKQLDSKLENVGESWEISGVEGCESVVAEGDFKGRRLDEILAEMKGKLVGEDNYKQYGNRFPLLVKLLDVQKDLSVQVHPNDEQARKYGMPNGKSEMWYMMNISGDATLRCGLKKKITPEEYKRMVENDTICDAIADYHVKNDDCFYIPAGRIHCAGPGCMMVEFQQTSDATFRIYDFKRKDKDGNYRELHTEKAAECIDYSVLDDYHTSYVPVKNEGVQLINGPYFYTSVYDLDEPMTLDYSDLDSFVIFVCVAGEGSFMDDEGNETTLRVGETVLLPATVQTVSFSGTLKFLETFV